MTEIIPGFEAIHLIEAAKTWLEQGQEICSTIMAVGGDTPPILMAVPVPDTFHERLVVFSKAGALCAVHNDDIELVCFLSDAYVKSEKKGEQPIERNHRLIDDPGATEALIVAYRSREGEISGVTTLDYERIPELDGTRFVWGELRTVESDPATESHVENPLLEEFFLGTLRRDEYIQRVGSENIPPPQEILRSDLDE